MGTNDMIPVQEVAQIVGRGERTIWRWAQNALYNFPQPVHLTPRMVRWRTEDVNRWLTGEAQDEVKSTPEPPPPRKRGRPRKYFD